VGDAQRVTVVMGDGNECLCESLGPWQRKLAVTGVMGSTAGQG
jgi:hypothetical protein